MVDAPGEGTHGSYADSCGESEVVDLVAKFGWEVEEAENFFFCFFFFFFLAGLRVLGRRCRHGCEDAIALKVCWGVEVVMLLFCDGVVCCGGGGRKIRDQDECETGALEIERG